MRTAAGQVQQVARELEISKTGQSDPETAVEHVWAPDGSRAAATPAATARTKWRDVGPVTDTTVPLVGEGILLSRPTAFCGSRVNARRVSFANDQEWSQKPRSKRGTRWIPSFRGVLRCCTLRLLIDGQTGDHGKNCSCCEIVPPAPPSPPALSAGLPHA